MSGTVISGGSSGAWSPGTRRSDWPGTALLVQTILGTIVLILSDLLTDPAENTNWVSATIHPGETSTSSGSND